MTDITIPLHSFVNPVEVSGGLTYTTNLYAWYKADALALNDNDAVGTWADSSGNGRDITQSTADNKPVYKTNIQNGKPAVRLDGSNDCLDSGTWNLSQPITYFYVCKANDSNVMLIYANVGSRGDIFRETNIYTNWGSQDTIGSDTFGAFHYYMHKINGASSVHRYDGANDVTHNPGANSLVQFRMGSNIGGYEPAIDYCEFLIYSEAISDANRNTVESYLATKYGL